MKMLAVYLTRDSSPSFLFCLSQPTPPTFARSCIIKGDKLEGKFSLLQIASDRDGNYGSIRLEFLFINQSLP
jgi:hypothetical protein